MGDMDKAFKLLQQLEAIQSRVDRVQQQLGFARTLIQEHFEQHQTTLQLNVSDSRTLLYDNAGPSFTIWSLSVGLWEKILEYLSPRDLNALSLTCVAMNQISQCPNYWQKQTRALLADYSLVSRFPIVLDVTDKQLTGLMKKTVDNWNRGSYKQGKYAKRDSNVGISSLYVTNGLEPRLLVFCETLFEEWDLEGNLHHRSNFESKVLHAFCSHDSMAISFPEALRIYDLKSKAKKYELKDLYSEANRVVANELYIAVGCWDGAIKIFSHVDGTLTCSFSGHQKPIYAMDQYGSLLVTGSSDRTSKLWSITNQLQLITLRGHRKTITDAILIPSTLGNPEASYILTSSKDETVRIWDIETGGETSCFEGHTKAVNCITTMGLNRILSGSSDGTIKLWDSRQKDAVHTFLSSTNVGTVNALYADPFRVISGHQSGAIIQHEFWH